MPPGSPNHLVKYACGCVWQRFLLPGAEFPLLFMSRDRVWWWGAGSGAETEQNFKMMWLGLECFTRKPIKGARMSPLYEDPGTVCEECRIPSGRMARWGCLFKGQSISFLAIVWVQRAIWMPPRNSLGFQEVPGTSYVMELAPGLVLTPACL